MDTTKNGMYSRAGRTNGWIQSADTMQTPVPAPAPPPTPVPTPMPMPIPMPMPTPISMPMPAPMPRPQPMPVPTPMPEPPVVELPNLGGNTLCTTPVMAYVPVQKWQDLYDVEQGFGRGTIFTELDLPFVGEGACRHE